MKKTYYSNGKLLLTGEYAVLDGATGLAIPTKLGQSLTVEPNNSQLIQWKSLDKDGNCWFETEIPIHLKTPHKGTNDIEGTLLEILAEAQRLNPKFLNDDQGYSVITQLDFPRNWGLGTSSTLINNIAQWAEVDAFQLLENSFGGSGYDIAAAQNDQAILYTKNTPPLVQPVHLPWEFKDQLFFVYLNQKQNSKEGINRYKELEVNPHQLVKISDLSKKLLLCYELTDFQKIMDAHEALISEMIHLPTIKERLFPDYNGSIKSLGAWGGDFVLATGSAKELQYFKHKGYNTILSFSEMVM